MPHSPSMTAVAVTVFLAFLPGLACAQFKPSHPVRIISPSSAGSGPDAALRAVAQGLSQKWGQPVVVENRPGGNGFIAISAFKGHAPDGHELINADGSHVTVHPHTFRKLPYDPVADLEPVRSLLVSNFFVAVARDSPFKTVDDIVRAAKLKTDGVTYGSYFIGSPPHLGGLKLQSLTGVKMLHIPYKDTVQLYASVANGQVDWALGSIASAGPLEKSGRIRFITVAAPKRYALQPDVPASAESSLARDWNVTGWTGIFAPKGTPAAIREQIANDIADVLATPQMKERYRNFGYQDQALKTDALAAEIRKESAEWKKVVNDAGLRLDD